MKTRKQRNVKKKKKKGSVENSAGAKVAQEKGYIQDDNKIWRAGNHKWT